MTKKLLAVGVLLLMCVTTNAQKLKLSREHGICDEPFSVSITDADGLTTGGAAIYYTTDGSVPTVTSTKYSSPIHIQGTTVLRTAVIGSDCSLLSEVTTSTYLFLDNVLKQTDSPDGYPAEWGAFSTISGVAPADYGMDEEMTSDPVLASKIKEGLLSIPVLSIVTDRDNLFNHENDEEKGGIYIFTGPPVGDGTGNGWTRPASAELFGCEHDFSVTCGLKLHGGHGRLAEKNPKHSMRLVFKKEYGKKSLEYPLFGEDMPDKFNQLVLRCHFGNSWQHWAEDDREKAQYTRDVWARRMQRKMGWTSVNALYVHVFLNGMYWGLYNIAERVDDQFGKNYLGGKKEDVDVVKIEEENGSHVEASEGDLDAWNLMLDAVAKADDKTYYYMLQGKDAYGNDDADTEKLLDIDAFIDYMLINQYGGNWDWDHHNWYAIRRKGAESQGFRFLCWDTEMIFESLSENNLKKNNNQAPTGIFNALMKNKSFVRKYMARAEELLSDDGLLGQQSVEQVWDSLYRNISSALYAESARWGDYRRDVHAWQAKGKLYTVDETYMKERKRLHEKYFPSRSSRVLDMINSAFGAYISDDIALGDVNEDDEIDGYDLVGIVNLILNTNTDGLNRDVADVNQDGEVDGYDYVALVNTILGNNRSETSDTIYASDFNNGMTGGMPQGWIAVNEAGQHRYGFVEGTSKQLNYDWGANPGGGGARLYDGFSGDFTKALYWGTRTTNEGYASYGELIRDYLNDDGSLDEEALADLTKTTGVTADDISLYLLPGQYNVSFKMAAWKGEPVFSFTLEDLDGNIHAQFNDYTAKPNLNGSKGKVSGTLSLKADFQIENAGYYVMKFVAQEDEWQEFLLSDVQVVKLRSQTSTHLNEQATDNVNLELQPSTLMANGEMMMQLKITGYADDFTLIQTDLTLPEGLEPVMKNGRIVAKYNPRALSEDDDHSLQCSRLENGTYRILALSQTNTTFDANGEYLLYIPVTVSENLSEGIYEVMLDNTRLVKPDATGVNPTSTSVTLEYENYSNSINSIAESNSHSIYNLNGVRIGKNNTERVLIINGKKTITK